MVADVAFVVYDRPDVMDWWAHQTGLLFIYSFFSRVFISSSSASPSLFDSTSASHDLAHE